MYRAVFHLRTLVSIGAMTLFCGQAVADVVVADHGVGITRAEMEAIVAGAPEKVQNGAANDLGDRFELLNSLMITRRLAAEADALTPEDEDYWNLYFELVSVKQTFMFNKLLRDTKMPDPESLAREYYETRKDQYALVGEKRASSHILLMAPTGQDRTEVRQRAQDILDQLRAGADWDVMVAEHSEDSGTAARNGALSRSITFGDPGITPPYSEALFKIESVGEFSEITDSQFGIHIIRLDGIEPAYYREYDAVRDAIVADIEREHRGLAAREIRRRYNLSDDAFIDGDAMDEIFAPYRTRP